MAAFCGVYLNITYFSYKAVVKSGMKWAHALPIYTDCGGVL